jgi:hypothetical protein
MLNWAFPIRFGTPSENARGFSESELEQFPDRQSASRHDRQYHRRVDHGCGGLLVRLLTQEAALTTCLSRVGTGLLLQLHQG